ncbi:MAG TPA: ATP-binding protein [Gammaproteobacteria bacterium]|nr:ATP-binding protein [Gammaproteobacteria bacterium]
MIERKIRLNIEKSLNRQPAVAIIGPRQVGKTTLALDIAENRKSIYLDLESYRDRDKLEDPILFLERYEDSLVILDEIYRMPELFQTLRGLIDEGRRRGKKVGRFLILGSASIDLLRQSGETLAGRIGYIDMTPLTALEIKPDQVTDLWIRGGFPDSFLGNSDEDSFLIRKDFIRTYLEREIPQFAPRTAAETLERLWMMLAHCQGSMLNASRLASNLSISAKTLNAYIDLLIDLLLFRRLKPYHANIGKRLVKSPKTYIRDSGLLHALLNIKDYNELAGHPITGESWEGFVIENILSVVPLGTKATFYRTSAGAEIDLVLEMVNSEIWAIEIKSGLTAKPSKGFYHAIDDIKSTHNFVIHAGKDQYPITENIEAISLIDCMRLLEQK